MKQRRRKLSGPRNYHNYLYSNIETLIKTHTNAHVTQMISDFMDTMPMPQTATSTPPPHSTNQNLLTNHSLQDQTSPPILLLGNHDLDIVDTKPNTSLHLYTTAPCKPPSTKASYVKRPKHKTTILHHVSLLY